MYLGTLYGGSSSRAICTAAVTPRDLPSSLSSPGTTEISGLNYWLNLHHHRQDHVPTTSGFPLLPPLSASLFIGAVSDLRSLRLIGARCVEVLSPVRSNTSPAPRDPGYILFPKTRTLTLRGATLRHNGEHMRETPIQRRRGRLRARPGMYVRRLGWLWLFPFSAPSPLLVVLLATGKSVSLFIHSSRWIDESRKQETGNRKQTPLVV